MNMSYKLQPKPNMNTKAAIAETAIGNAILKMSSFLTRAKRWFPDVFLSAGAPI